MARKFAIFYKEKDMVPSAQNIINKRFDFENVTSLESDDGYFVVICTFGFLNKTPDKMAEDVVGTLGLNESPAVEDYGFISSSYMRMITIDGINSGFRKGMSY